MQYILHIVKMKDVLLKIFDEPNAAIEKENLEREEMGTVKIRSVEIQILGQVTLLANEMAAKVLPLQRTGDLDAVIKSTHFFVKDTLVKTILPKFNLVYDEDSEKIWIPPGSRFETLCTHRCFMVKLLDPESALVSKAIKAPAKNRLLIVEAIASEAFPALIERIQKHGGDLTFFLEVEDE